MNDTQISDWRIECKANQVIKKMEKRGFNACYAATAAEAKKAIINLVPETGVVALLGSQTMNQLGVFTYFRENGRDLVDHAVQAKGLSPEETRNYLRRVFTADTMLASANAVDDEGRLYNIDGIGNRVGAMIFGPDKVVLGISMSKVGGSQQEAWHRARNVASPMNNKRLNMPNPCTKSGHCHDCQIESSICSYFTIIERSKPAGRINVVLIGESYGY